MFGVYRVRWPNSGKTLSDVRIEIVAEGALARGAYPSIFEETYPIN